jgi:hypothetical protein
MENMQYLMDHKVKQQNKRDPDGKREKIVEGIADGIRISACNIQ